MKASDLKTLVDLLSPCLGDAALLPVLGNICFDVDGVYAYNDIVATCYRWEHGLGTFGVDGKPLLNLLSQYHKSDEEVKLRLLPDSILEVKIGRSVVKLPTLEQSAFIFEPPTKGSNVEARIGRDKTERQRLRDVLEATATSSVMPVYKAVVLGINKGHFDLMAFAANGPTMIHACVGKGKQAPAADQRWIVPKLAITQLLTALDVSGEDGGRLALSKEYLVGVCGDIIVTAKLLQDTVPNFYTPLQATSQVTLEKWRTPELLTALGVASALGASYTGTVTTFQIEKQAMVLHTKGGKADAVDTIKLEKACDNFNFSMDPNLFRKAFSFESLDGALKLNDAAAVFGDSKSFLFAAAFTGVRAKAAAPPVEEDKIPF